MDTWYAVLGPEGIRALVDRFYAEVFKSPVISPLFQNPKEEIVAKQYAFLTQFLGGPQLYMEQYGVPKMRFRHLPHVIDNQAMVEWLRCMQLSIEQLEFLSGAEKERLLAVFIPLAKHMRNS
jgi:hemoglobin